MDLHALLLKWGLRIRVLHRLPGRLRLEISALRKVPPGTQEFARELIGKMVLPAGITSVEPSFITGSVLLKYDSGAATEQEVLANIHELLSALVDYRDELWSIGQENGHAAIEKLNGVLNKANRKDVKREEDDVRS
ncbi:MAG: HMA2 domain-containing protein [Thermodesulfobacteriota bacterium]